ETGVRVNPIICINREISSEESKKIIKSALKFQGRGIVGVDLACYEPGNPPEKHKKAIEMTFDSSLKRTFHVGEMCGEEENLRNIETVLNNFRPHGISHAVDLWRRNDLIDKLVENKIRLESNPISNYNFFINKLEDLHLDELMKKSVLITINPDDPMMWPNGEMVHNLYQMGKIYGNEFVEKALENAKETAWN
ncbi:MAG: hypothetical protein KKB62_01465, partial [Nanoarchaeota archaeon]|nr:hypothetical protein [Nanoarchaeota archaeon]